MVKKKNYWAVVYRGIPRYTGLMFKLSSPNLLFIFNKPAKKSIHSFFCKTFKATWYDYDGTIIESKIIKPFFWDLKPARNFYFLTEELLS